MHSFVDLIDRGTALILRSLNETRDELINSGTSTASTALIKNLQMIELQRAIMAVGMFSMFEPILKRDLNCRGDGFVGAKNFLEKNGQHKLRKRLLLFVAAVNVLKHGRGRSYEALLEESEELPFRLLKPDEYYFSEGDVSEVHTLVQVTDDFVMDCTAVIREVSDLIRKANLAAST